jgi:hypothetical protein
MLAEGESTDLATLRGPAHLVVGGDRVALRSFSTDDAGGTEVLAQSLPIVAPDSLAVVGLDDGEVVTVAQGGIVSFFWDPTGRRLLYLAGSGLDPTELRWHVWEDGVVSDLASFLPDPSWMANFAPFFDQYALSMSLWSPDGSAFAFPGTVGGESGVWVQHLDQETPVRVSSGSWVAWGPAG